MHPGCREASALVFSIFRHGGNILEALPAHLRETAMVTKNSEATGNKMERRQDFFGGTRYPTNREKPSPYLKILIATSIAASRNSSAVAF